MDSHLDADRLAAFMDGSLSRKERTAVEAHAADCPRCLQLLAAMARTEPAAPSGGWRLPVMVRWAMPFAAAAAALGFWLNVERAPRESRESTAPAAAAPVAETSSVPPRVAETPPAATLERTPSAKATRPAEQERREARRALADSPSGAADRSARQEPSARQAVGSDPNASPGGPAPLIAPVAPLPPSVAEQSAPAPPPLGTPAPVSETRADTARLRATGSVASSTPAVTAGRVILTSPDGVPRWRVRGDAVERSVDAGVTWVAQRVSGAQVLAGAASSPTVAWLVGRAGTVLRTVDGERWERVPFPESVDLVRVLARSDRIAELTTADSRTFLTTDGGHTWTRKPQR